MTNGFDTDSELNAIRDARNRAQLASVLWHRAYGRAVIAGLCTLFGLRAAILIFAPPGPEPSFTPQLTGIAATLVFLFVIVLTLARHHGFTRLKLATVLIATLIGSALYELGWLYIPPKLGFEVGLWWPNLGLVFLAPIVFEMWHVSRSGVPHLLYSEVGAPFPDSKKPWLVAAFWLLITLGVLTLWILIRAGSH